MAEVSRELIDQILEKVEDFCMSDAENGGEALFN